MGHSREALTPNLAERWGWQAAQRDEARVARRLSRNAVADGVSRRDAGARRDDFCPFWRELGGRAWRADVQPRRVSPSGGQSCRTCGPMGCSP